MPFTMISATESIARYIEKTDSDSFLLIISTSFIDISPVIKAVAMDIITGVTATAVTGAEKRSVTKPPAIIGTDSRKLFSAAVCLSSPASVAAVMVRPLRDSPGMTAIPCAAPTKRQDKKPRLRLGLYHLPTSSIAAVSIKHRGSSLPFCM